MLVDRGWVPEDWKLEHKHWANASGLRTITGIVYKGDNSNKYSKTNEARENRWYTVKPDQIATFRLLDNKEDISGFLIKQIEFNPKARGMFPRILNVSDIRSYYVDYESNFKMAGMWKVATFLNLFSNLLIWLYL